MIEYINTIYCFLNYLFYVLLFCYLYNPLYTSCNVLKKIKKNGKTKTISQPKSVLAVIYLILLYIIFKCFTFKIILFIIMLLIIVSLVLTDKFTSTLNDYLYNLNKSSIMIICWKILHTFFTLVYVITQPVFSVINNYMYDKIKLFKKIFNHIANLNLSDDSDKNINNEILKLSEEMSNMSDYFFKSQKKEIEEKNNTSKSISDINDISQTISSSNSNSNSNIINETNEKTKTEKNKTDIIETDETNNKTNSSSSKCEMVKKIDEINKIIDKSIDDNIEDMTITEN